MTTGRYISFYLIIVGCFFSTALLAQPGERGGKTTADTSGSGGNTYAIIVGLSQYKSVKPLQYAHRDAKAFQDLLLSPAGGKVPASNVELFINEQATRSNVGDAISEIRKKAKPGDRVYFFFAGHGDMEDLTQIENGLLLLYNSPNGNYFGMNDDVLEILDLKRYLSPLAQKGVEMIFIVDACHSGNLKGGIEGSQQTAAALASAWGKEYKILSCQPNQLSLEGPEWGGGRGLFSLELEEGMKGLADKNNDGKITFAELQRYITDNVSSYSEDKQIPLISGDLSRSFIRVDSATLAALKKQKASNYPMLASANTKGAEEKYIDSLDPAGKKIYYSFVKNLESKKLILPADTNALKDYRVFVRKYNDNILVAGMRRNLAAALNERFNSIVDPLLKGQTSYSTREECNYAGAELDSCLRLLGEQHYMYTNLKARKLFMNAMALTWAMSPTDYTLALKPTVEQSIHFLEQSEELEPNAAYTLQQLGLLYYVMFDYEKAFPQFQKYLDLRPNDYYAKRSLAFIYNSVGKYDKAEELFLQLNKAYPRELDIYEGLADTYRNNFQLDKSLKVAQWMIDSLKDRGSGYFEKGVNYSFVNNIDSAVHYYLLSAKYSTDRRACYNNIGHIYFLNNQDDMAMRYFNMVLKQDSLFPYTNFNIATIEVRQGRVNAAASRFLKTIQNSTRYDECFNNNLQLYFQKNYHVEDQVLYAAFKKKSFVFSFQYFSYLSVLYCFLRSESLRADAKTTELIFNELRNYKQHDALTAYHYACYRALINDEKGAMESLQKAVTLGFNSYFMLTSDADLDLVRQDPAYKALLQKYFPSGKAYKF